VRYRRRTGQELSEGDDTEFRDLPGKTLLRPDEVARFLSVSIKTIMRWYHSGLIEGVKAGGSLRIYRESIVSLVEEKDSPSHE